MKSRTETLRDLLNERLLFFDPGTGTFLQKIVISEEARRGEEFKNHPVSLQGNDEVLTLTNPDLILQMHKQFLEAGSNIISTVTFNANAICQQQYQLTPHIRRMNSSAAKIAVCATQEYIKTHDLPPHARPYVAGSIGPTSQTASVALENAEERQITFDELFNVYREQIIGLIEGGVDILILETAFDALNCKAAIAAMQSVFEETHIQLPIWISLTVSDYSTSSSSSSTTNTTSDSSSTSSTTSSSSSASAHRTLAGQTIEAFFISVEHAQPLIVGFNCIPNVENLETYLYKLCDVCPNCFIYASPNAGLPNELGKYEVSGIQLAEKVKNLAEKKLLNVIGGCCGTTVDYIKEVIRLCSSLPPRKPFPAKQSLRLSGLDPLTVYPNQNESVVVIGERCSVSGSIVFRRSVLKALESGDWRDAIAVAQKQISNSAQCLDISFDHCEIPNPADTMRRFLLQLGAYPEIARVPLCIDSTDIKVIETALKITQGKCLVNSVNLKDGEKALIERVRICRRYGAAIVVMMVDENGQAETAERKIAIADRSIRLLTHSNVYVPTCDIVLDLCVLTIATGIEEHNPFALEFINALKVLRQTFPTVAFCGGTSNLSYAFRGNERIRQLMHSVFLEHSKRVGLSLAFLSTHNMISYESIDKHTRTVVKNVILNRSPNLNALVEIAQQKTTALESAEQKERNPFEGLTISQRLSYAIVSGDSTHLQADLLKALETMNALEIVEHALQHGLAEVGKLFKDGMMFLPQVLRSSQVMKEAMAVLSPFISSLSDSSSLQANTMVLATVRHDIHDIGKNIASVVLSCNGFSIVDLGINVASQDIISACVSHNAVAVGLSGMISPSLREMESFVELLENTTTLSIPIIVGGAATSALHTALVLAPKYSRGVVCAAGTAADSVETLKKLTHPKTKTKFAEELLKTQEKLRQAYYAKAEHQQFVSLVEARARRFQYVKGNQLSNTELIKDGNIFKYKVHLVDLLPFVNWDSLFTVFGLKGEFPNQYYPNILEDNQCGKEAKRLFTLCRSLANEWDHTGKLEALGLAGIFPANAVNEDIEVYSDHNRSTVKSVLHTLRGQIEQGNPLFPCVADYFAPKGIEDDYIGMFVVTGSHGIEKITDTFVQKGEDEKRVLCEAFSHRLTEAMAVYVHRDVLSHLGLKEQGTRPAIGYPQIPDHSEKVTVFNLLGSEKGDFGERLDEIGVDLLIPSMMMRPTGSICALVVHNKDSKYGNVGRLGTDQIEDYVKRKATTVEQLRKTLVIDL